MTAQPANISAFIDAARDSLAREIATVRREAQRERDTFAAEMRAVRAEWDVRLAAVSDIERRMADRLATLKDGEPGRDGHDGASVCVDDVLPALIERAGAVAAEHAAAILATWERPKDGRDGAPGEKGDHGEDGAPGVAPTADEVAALVLDEVKAAALEVVAAIPAPRDGKDTDPAHVERMVADAIARIPAAKDGRDGRDGASVTLADVLPVLREAIAAIPVPKDGRDGIDGKDGERGADGTSVTVDDVVPLIEARVADAVAAIPLPRDGVDGKDGAPGERGPEGPIGALPVVKAWEDRVYYQGEVVSLDGSAFQANRDTGKAPPNDDWTCIVSRGADGADGRSFTIRGTYGADEEYRALDVVALNGASFAARRDNPGPCPGDGWQLIAGQGKQGKPGERGEAGRQGTPGPAGPAVSAASIGDDGVFRLVNADGSTVDADFYPLLSRLG